MTWFLPVVVLGGFLPLGLVVAWLGLTMLWVLHGHRIRRWRVRVHGAEVRYSQPEAGEWMTITFPFDRRAVPPTLFLGDDFSWGRRPESAQRSRVKITRRVRRSLLRIDIRHEELLVSPPNSQPASAPSGARA